MCEQVSNLLSPYGFEMQQNPFSAGAPPRTPLGELTSYDAPPDRLVGWGGGYPLPIPLTLNASGVSNSAPMAPRLCGRVLLQTFLGPVATITSMHTL